MYKAITYKVDIYWILDSEIENFEFLGFLLCKNHHNECTDAKNIGLTLYPISCFEEPHNIKKKS